MSEERIVRVDSDLKIEAYQFNGIMQKFPNHFHEHYVIGFIERGRRHLSCKNKDYIIEPGDLMIFNPRDNHTCEQIDNRTLDYRCLNINEDIMKKIMHEITDNEYLPCFSQNVIFHSEQVSLLREVHEMIMQERKEFEKEEKLLFLMKILIDNYAESINSDDFNDNKDIGNICEFIDENYYSSITLDELSEISKMNKYGMIRKFTKLKGVTPYQYLQTVRINKAKELLEKGEEVVDVACKTGFTDQSHFTNFFKRFIGLTPGQYKDIFK